VSAADVAAKHLGAIAALQADHIIPTHGLANRYSGGECFFDRSLSSKLTEASVYDDDEFRNLTCPDCIVSQIASNDFRGKKSIAALSVHGSLRDYAAKSNIQNRNDKKTKKSFTSPSYEFRASCRADSREVSPYCFGIS
jgi:hypothetical protein